MLWSVPSPIPWATDTQHSGISGVQQSSDFFLRGRTFVIQKEESGDGEGGGEWEPLHVQSFGTWKKSSFPLHVFRQSFSFMGK